MADSRINLYHNLSTMLNAGVPIIRAIQNVQKQGRFGRLFKKIEVHVASGMSLADIIELYHREFKPLDRALISIGEQTGQVAEMLEQLSQWYAFRQRLANTMKIGAVLPIFYVHFAALTLPIVPFALGGWDKMVYIKGVLGILGAFYIPALLIAGIIYLTPRQGILRYILDSILVYTPVAGKAFRELSLSRYCKTFSIMYKAGVPILECARMATESAGNLVMRRRLAGAYEMARTGEEMSKGFSRSLPAEFIAIWEVGEESGELDESAARLGNMHAENAERRFGLLAKVIPLGFYLIVLAFIGYFIIAFYMKIFSSYSL